MTLDHLAFNSPRARTINFAGILVLAAAVPTDRLHWLPVRSVWENAFGVKPYSSGMTRAMSRLMHGDLEGAWAFNPLAFVVLAVFVLLIGLNGVRWAHRRRRRQGGAEGSPG